MNNRIQWQQQVLLLMCATALMVACCALDPAIVTVWGGDVKTPVLVSVQASSASRIQTVFSSPVSLRNAALCAPDTGESAEATAVLNAEIEEAGATAADTSFFVLELALVEGMQAGKKYVLNGTVLDAHGNSLGFAVPLTGYNDRVPRLLINEIRTDYSKPKVEFVELLALSAGNLAGVRLVNAANVTDPVYEFPACEVTSGEYIVLHFRSVEELLVNELGEDLALSGGTEALPTARDLWAPYERAPLKKTNVLLLEERKGGAVLDAFLGCESDKPVWPSEAMITAASEALAAAAWGPDDSVGSAVVMTGTTTTRTIGRNELSADTNSAADWKIAPTSKASPGRVNIAH